MKPSTWIVLAVTAGAAAIAARRALRPNADSLSRGLSDRCDDLTRQLQFRLDQRQAG